MDPNDTGPVLSSALSSGPPSISISRPTPTRQTFFEKDPEGLRRYWRTMTTRAGVCDCV